MMQKDCLGNIPGYILKCQRGSGGAIAMVEACVGFVVRGVFGRIADTFLKRHVGR